MMMPQSIFKTPEMLNVLLTRPTLHLEFGLRPRNVPDFWISKAAGRKHIVTQLDWVLLGRTVFFCRSWIKVLHKLNPWYDDGSNGKVKESKPFFFLQLMLGDLKVSTSSLNSCWDIKFRPQMWTLCLTLRKRRTLSSFGDLETFESGPHGELTDYLSLMELKENAWTTNKPSWSAEAWWDTIVCHQHNRHAEASQPVMDEQDALLRFRVSPLGHRLLSQSPVTRSPRPAFALTAELFIKGEESTGDPANFSMGLLAVLAVQAVQWKDKPRGLGLKWSVSILLIIFMKWTSPSVHTIKSALSDSLTCGTAEGSCVSWTDTALAAFKDTGWWYVGVWIRPSQIY